MFQNLIVALAVMASAAYALWTLAPRAVRRVTAQGLLRLPLPVRLRAHLLAASQQGSGCGCSGCDRAVPVAGNPQVRPQVITVHRPSRNR